MKAPLSQPLRRYLAALAAEERSLERLLFHTLESERRQARAEWRAAFRQLRQRLIQSELEHGRHAGFQVPVALPLFPETVFPDDLPVVRVRPSTHYSLQRCA